ARRRGRAGWRNSPTLQRRKAASPSSPRFFPTDVSQQVQDSLQSMLKMTGEIEQCSDEIEVEIEQAKEGVADKYRVLEEEKERFQKVALAALNILSGGI
uniref:Uncharacterized protein n=1 Tax=Aegilops tauschii subsp. strangulata TaxID=200361 RepID=A0A452Y569_AEGTS